MKIVLTIAAIVSLPIMLGTLFMSLGSMGELLAALYANDRDSWVKEGSPTTFGWNPPNGDPLQGQIPGTILAIKILFITPQWIKSIPNGPRILSRLRISTVLGYLSMAALFILLINLAVLPSA